MEEPEKEYKKCTITVEFENAYGVKSFTTRENASVGWKILFNRVKPMLEFKKGDNGENV